MNSYTCPLKAVVLMFVACAAAAGPESQGRDINIEILERTAKQKVYIAEDGHPQVTRTDQLRGFNRVIVGFTKFYSDKTDKSAFDIQLNLIDPNGEPKLIAAMPDACEVEGGSPQLRSFFFIDVDKDSEMEIGVICGWKEHAAADCPQFDQARFFKLVRKPDRTFDLKRIDGEDFKTLYHGERSTTDSKLVCEGAPNFKSAADIRRMVSKFKH